jgi:hypothetical protein
VETGSAESSLTMGWVKSQFSLSLVVHICLTVGGWVAVISTLKADVAELTRRVTVLENEVVPRKEHEAKDRFEEQREHLLDERLTAMERQLDQILERK